ncbi:MAG: hypothetical protein NTW19_15245, partial [Planctomycetota bacterium]|nr:hypothetical protein [Planctomycetota bacterium]
MSISWQSWLRRRVLKAGRQAKKTRSLGRGAQLRHSPLLEALESRILLASAPYQDHNLTNPDRIGILNGLSNIAAGFYNQLERTGTLAQQIPGIKESLGNAADVGHALQKQIYDPISTFLEINPNSSTDQLISKLKTLNATVGNLTFSIDPNVTGGLLTSATVGDDIEFNLIVHVSRSLSSKVDLGRRWESLSINADETGVVPTTVSATLDFQFGVGQGNFLLGPNNSFVKFNQLAYAADVNTSGLNFGVDIGFLGATVQNGSFNLHATADVAIGDPTPDVRGVILTFSQLSTALGSFTTMTGGGTANINLPLAASLGGYTAAGTPTISLSSNAILGATPVEMTTNAAFDPLLNFSTFTSGSFNNLLGQLGSWLNMLRLSSQFDAQVPWVDPTKLSALIDLEKAFNDRVVSPLTGPLSTPTYHNAQTFTTALAAALGVSEASLAPHYDPATSDLTYHVNFTQALASTTEQLNLTAVPEPLQILSNAGDVTLTPTAHLDMVFGAHFSPLQATLTSGADAPANGRFTGTAVFTLKNGQAAPVNVSVAGDATNNSMDDLVADFNAALAAAGISSQVLAGRSGNRLTFTTRGAGVAPLVVLGASPGNPMVAAFGFTDGQLALKTLDSRFFIRNADLSGTVTSSLSNPLVGGRIGFINFGSSTGSVASTITARTLIKDPVTGTASGNAYLHDLINDVPDDVNLVASAPIITGNATATLPVTVNPAVFGLGSGSPVVTVNWTNIANPATLGVAYNADAQPLLEFSKVGSADVAAAIQSFATFLGNQQTTGLYGQKLPGLNRTVGQLLDLGALTAQDGLDFAGRPAGAVQFLAHGVADAFGLPDSSVAVTFSNHLLRVNITTAASDTASQPIALDLALLAALLPTGDPAKAAIGALQLLVGSGNAGKVPVTLDAVMHLNLGVDLTTPGTPRPFIDNTTNVIVDVSANGTGLSFKAGLGPLGLSVANGSFTIGGDANPATADAARFTLALASNVAGRRYLSELTPAAAAASIAGQVNINLPLAYPAPANGLGTLHVAATNLGNLAGSLVVTTPNLAGLATSIDLSNNLGTVIDGTDALLLTLQSAVNTQVFNNDFPIIGRALTGVDQFLGKDLREAIVAQLHAKLDGGATPSLDLVRQALYAALGPAGLYVLAPTTSCGDFRD